MISDGRFKFFKCHLRHIKSIVPRLRRHQKSCYRSLKICGFIFLCGFCSELREHKTRQERSTSVNKNGFNFKHSRKIYKNYARARAKKYVLWEISSCCHSKLLNEALFFHLFAAARLSKLNFITRHARQNHSPKCIRLHSLVLLSVCCIFSWESRDLSWRSHKVGKMTTWRWMNALRNIEKI